MAQRRVITESFDLYPGVSTAGFGLLSSWPQSTGTNNLGAGRFGGQAYVNNYNSDSDLLRRAHPSTTQLVLGAAIYIRTFYTSGRLFSFRSTNNNEQIYIRSDAAGRALVYAGATLLAQTADPVFTLNAWHYLEMAVNLSDTTGSARAWLNDFELTELAVDNVDTKGHADPDFGVIQLAPGNQYYDDLYLEIDGLTRVGEGRMFPLTVNADVDTDFSPSQGSTNYENLNQVPFSATRYNASDELGAVDMFQVTDLSFSPQQIYGLQVVSLSSKDEAGSRAHVNRIQSGATVSEGDQFVETLNSNIIARDYFPLNPDTGTSWNFSTTNGVRIGYRISV
ncbi:hypothetical protein [Sphingomonas phage Kimi]|nr:hypothetical protein [Sphingomonas phage Kimi]